MEDSITREQLFLRQEVLDTIRAFMREKGVPESFYDKITSGTGACENVPTVYQINDPHNFSLLSQTDQLYMEAQIIRLGLSSLYTAGRSFRKEPRAGDGRHLSEFTLLEFEAVDMDLEGLLNFQEELLNKVIEEGLESEHIPEKHKDRLRKFLENGYKRVTYTEIVNKLSDGGVSINWGDDLSSRDEEAICLLCGGPTQVTHYPEEIKFFNMYRTQRDTLGDLHRIQKEEETDTTTVDCVDFLLPWAGETFGGSRREELYSVLTAKLLRGEMFKQMQKAREESGYKYDQDATLEAFNWYLELFKDKEITRSGFGLGMGRLVQFLQGSTRVVSF